MKKTTEQLKREWDAAEAAFVKAERRDGYRSDLAHAAVWAKQAYLASLEGR